MPKLVKPSIKMQWRGQKGNKFRSWKVTNQQGNTYVYTNKEIAYRTYNSAVRMYKKIKTKYK